MSAASRARRVNPQMEVVVLEKGEYVSYGTCGLAYLVSGVVPRPDDLVVHPPDYFRAERGIDVRTGHEVTDIVPGQRQVVARRGQETLALKYDKLVIAAGGAPAATLPGADGPGVFNINDMASTLALRRVLEERRPRTAAVIGGGYIGVAG